MDVPQARNMRIARLNARWGAVTIPKSADRGGLVAKVRPHGTSRECHRCHTTTAGSRETQERFVCKNPECGWACNADTNARRRLAQRVRHDH